MVTSSMKVKLKKLENNRKGVSQQRLGGKFDKNQTTKNRQTKKLEIKNYTRENTLKYNEETALKAKKRSRKLENLLYNSRAEVIG